MTTDNELARGDLPEIIACPKCGAQQEDHDGFGFIACVPGCGYCTHPSSTRETGQAFTCNICGAVCVECV